MSTLQLFARARNMAAALATLVLLAVLELSLGRAQLRLGADQSFMLPWGVCVPLLAGTAVGVFTGSAMTSWEDASARNIPAIRAAATLTLVALGALLVLLASLRLGGGYGITAAERNLLGATGLGLIAFWLLGDRLAWVLPSAYTLLALSAGVSGTRSARWAFMLSHDTDRFAAALAAVLFVVGLALCLFRQPRSAQLAAAVHL